MLERIDQQFFLYLNSFHSPFWDKVMYAVSGRVIWIPLYLAIVIFLIIHYKRKFLIILIFIILAATLSDQFSVIIKNIVQRLRPCHEPALTGMVHLVYNECGGLYSFVSSHATNSFDVAWLSLLFIRKRWFTVSILIWALIISYSRVYLGVHYPGDVICGSILGTFVGWSFYNLYAVTDRKLLSGRPFFNVSSHA